MSCTSYPYIALGTISLLLLKMKKCSFAVINTPLHYIYTHTAHKMEPIWYLLKPLKANLLYYKGKGNVRSNYIWNYFGQELTVRVPLCFKFLTCGCERENFAKQ